MTYHADFLDAEQRVADAIPERDVNPFPALQRCGEECW